MSFRKKILSLLLTSALLALAVSCGSDDSTSPDNEDGDITNDTPSGGGSTLANTEVDSSAYSVSVADESSATYEAAEVLSNITFAATVNINLTDRTVKIADTSETDITSAPATVYTGVSGSISVYLNEYGIVIESDTTENIIYSLSGTLSGSVTVSSPDADFQILLSNASISSSDSAALLLPSASRAFIVSAEDTENSLSDQSSRAESAEDYEAALFSGGALIFGGSGSISVSGNYKHGIYAQEHIRVSSGELNVDVSARDAVRCINGFIFDDGSLTINATGTKEDKESKGIKVDGTDENGGSGKGYVVINGGTINITSVSKGITASWDIDEDYTTATTDDDPNPTVTINSGIIDITTTGTPYENEVEGISCSPEGIEGKSRVVINSGYITISTADDAINAGTSIIINGGCIFAVSTANDSIDSNGTLTINGGYIVAAGAAAPEGAFDCDWNTFSITGGTLIGIGGSTSTPTASACTQNVLVVNSSDSKGDDILAVVDPEGNTAFAAVLPASGSTAVISSPLIQTGTEYSLYSGGSASSGAIFEGLLLDGIEYSGGETSATFTVSSSVTSVGSSGTTGGFPR